MRCQVRMSGTTWRQTRDYLLDSATERMAYLLARASAWRDPWGDETCDLLVQQALHVPDAALVVQTATRVEIDPAFTREVLVACFEAGLSLIDIHTQTFAQGAVAFSGHDTANMRQTHHDFLTGIPQSPPAVAASLVLSHGGVAGAWTDPATHGLRALTSLRLSGDRHEEVTLCGA